MHYDVSLYSYIRASIIACWFLIQNSSTVWCNQSLDTDLNEMARKFSKACQYFTSVMAIKHHLQYHLFNGTDLDTLQISLQTATGLLKVLQTQSKLLQKLEVSMQFVYNSDGSCVHYRI